MSSFASLSASVPLCSSGCIMRIPCFPTFTGKSPHCLFVCVMERALIQHCTVQCVLLTQVQCVHAHTHIWLFHSSRGVLGGLSLNRKIETERGVLQRDSSLSHSLSLYIGLMSRCSVSLEWKASMVSFFPQTHTYTRHTHKRTHSQRYN